MTIQIETRYDERRGCGWRQPGGTYLVSGGVPQPCGKLPLPLMVCPTCSHGIKPSRGWTWVDAEALIATKKCDAAGTPHCEMCPLALRFGRAGLIWVGEKFYKTPDEWTKEALRLGVSRRISAFPRDFVLGTTIVLMAHRKAIPLPANEQGEVEYQAGIFHIFKPTAIEYVVKGNESDDDLEALMKRSITPVRIERVGEQLAIDNDTDDDEEDVA